MNPKSKIYFFSGSGNSFATARDLAAQWDNTELINIASLLNEKEIIDKSALIGFIFPIYGGKPPKVVREWISRFQPGLNSTIFAICTCGIAPGHSLLDIDKILKTKNNRLRWGFAIKQAQSGIGSLKINTPELIKNRVEQQKIKIVEISRHIIADGPDHLEKSGKFSEFLNRDILKVLPTIGKLIWQLITKGLKNMKFHPGEQCNGCAICAKICPMENILMKDSFPVWNDNCAGCMACYHWCPENAVKNYDLDMIQSHHPEVTVMEMLRSKSDLD